MYHCQPWHRRQPIYGARVKQRESPVWRNIHDWSACGVTSTDSYLCLICCADHCLGRRFFLNHDARRIQTFTAAVSDVLSDYIRLRSFHSPHSKKLQRNSRFTRVVANMRRIFLAKLRRCDIFLLVDDGVDVSPLCWPLIELWSTHVVFRLYCGNDWLQMLQMSCISARLDSSFEGALAWILVVQRKSRHISSAISWILQILARLHTRSNFP